jgi:hypothetical protein
MGERFLHFQLNWNTTAIEVAAGIVPSQSFYNTPTSATVFKLDYPSVSSIE